MQKESILIVDDEPLNLQVLSQVLTPEYQVKVCKSGKDALRILSEPPLPGLILLDIMMPEMDGYETLAAIKQKQALKEVPVIFISALDSTLDEEKGFRLGAVDYIVKPFRSSIVRERIRVQMELKHIRDQLKRQNENLEKEIVRRIFEYQWIQDTTLSVIVQLAETRDTDTGNHIQRTREYMRILGKRLQQRENNREILTSANLDHIEKAAPLHDIGKIGVPDTILLKPGKLTEQEFDIMKKHCEIGGNAIREAIRKSSDLNETQTRKHAEIPITYLQVAKDIAIYHHERWDGGGYPYGLHGTEIPLAARMMALADVFDALTSERPYKQAWSFEEAQNYIIQQSGKQFDPEIVEAFKEEIGEFRAVYNRLKDRK